MYNRLYTGKIELAVLDTAGTFCDGPGDLRHRWPLDDLRGCKAPVVPFYEALREFGIECDWATIRKPMGNFKPTHLRMLLNLPEISSQWEEKYKRPWNEEDFDKILATFRPLMSKYIVDEDLAKPIPGSLEAIRKMREAGILVGCDTGYYQEDSFALNKVLEEKFGMKFDVVTNAEKVPGRPSPFMVYDCMLSAYKLTSKVIPCEAVVKIDDTAAGMKCGNNAGCWTIGLYASGSNTYDELAASKPDFLVPDVSYVPEIIFGQIEPRLRRGERPGQGIVETI
ncbi:HAD hydrolase-like protein [Sinanaerobacter chloroacetimidivorans]|jgi:phosphonoacetaldehyde hydrolase|uniref:HAD hydrolase-like protein n=1 Tax=Sinanaerobacter chloroacetimidivorans TaxID=2818044 RepID=A0A8J7W247_9FIRM|nr:HAD hydrolase-like protein [Sinanaerobacter chloroacetimidivorans]MBR0598986.1 HAD hydrolase-like protein [Sinanaerobacter chloroacetimidivorans]